MASDSDKAVEAAPAEDDRFDVEYFAERAVKLFDERDEYAVRAVAATDSQRKTWTEKQMRDAIVKVHKHEVSPYDGVPEASLPLELREEATG